MKSEDHRTADRLILQEQVEGLSAVEREWLDRHLEGCPACAQIAAGTSRALGRLRAISVPVPPALAGRTQARVYLRGLERRDQLRRGWAMWISCAVSWALGILSAPYVWRGFRWAGAVAGVPDAVWKLGVALWWAAPALAAVCVLLIDKWKRQEQQERYGDAGL